MPRRKGTEHKRSKRQVGEDYLGTVGAVVEALAQEGFEPTLVGGMALVALGSTRVTRDFDLLITQEAREHEALTKLFYGHGLELVSKLDERGEVVRTIDAAGVATVRLEVDQPKSAHFYNRRTGLRVDLLFDFPLRASEVHARATHRRVQGRTLAIASKEDLTTMKKIAVRNRKLAADSQDLELLKRL